MVDEIVVIAAARQQIARPARSTTRRNVSPTSSARLPITCAGEDRRPWGARGPLGARCCPSPDLLRARDRGRLRRAPRTTVDPEGERQTVLLSETTDGKPRPRRSSSELARRRARPPAARAGDGPPPIDPAAPRLRRGHRRSASMKALDRASRAGVMARAMRFRPVRGWSAGPLRRHSHLDEDIIGLARVPTGRISACASPCRYGRDGVSLGPQLDGALLGARRPPSASGSRSAGIGWALDRLAGSLANRFRSSSSPRAWRRFPETLSRTAFPRFSRGSWRRRTGLRRPVTAVGGPCIAAGARRGRER